MCGSFTRKRDPPYSGAPITNKHHPETSKSTESLCGQWRRVPKYPSIEVPALWSYVKQMAQSLVYLYPGIKTLLGNRLPYAQIMPGMEDCLSLLQTLGSVQAGIDTNGSAYPDITGLNATCQHSRICLLHLPQLMTWRWRWEFTDSKRQTFVLGLPHRSYLPGDSIAGLKDEYAFRTKIEQRAKKELKDLKLG